MKLSKHEFRRECHYTLTMIQTRRMLMERTISNREYWRMDRKMKMKYKPVSDGLILEYNLTNSQERASMQRGREGQHVDRKTD